MPTIDADDIADMLEGQDKGTYSPLAYAGQHPSSKSKNVDGVFLKDFVVISDIETYAPLFDCATADVSDAAHGAKLTVHLDGIESTTDVIYTVRGVQADGVGFTRLILEAP